MDVRNDQPPSARRARSARASVPPPPQKRGTLSAVGNDGVRVRVAQPADADALRSLRRQVEERHAALLPDYFQLAGTARTAPLPETAWAMVWVANVGRVVQGYLIAKIVETPNDPVMIPCRRMQIVEIGVDPAARRRGVGRRLMEVATDWGKRQGAKEAVLTVWSQNRAALALYNDLGFEPIARIMRRAMEPGDLVKRANGRSGTGVKSSARR